MSKKENDFSRILFVFAKEFGWGWEYIRTIPFKIFKMYVDEYVEYTKENEAASKGKKYKRELKPLTASDKSRRRQIIEETKAGTYGNNGNKDRR